MLNRLVVERKTRNVCRSALAHDNHQQDPVLLNPEFFFTRHHLTTAHSPSLLPERSKKEARFSSHSHNPDSQVKHTQRRLVLDLSSVPKSHVCLASALPLSGLTLYLSDVPLGVLGAHQALGGAQQQWPAFSPASPQSGLKCSLSLGVALLECQRRGSNAHFYHVRRTNELSLHGNVDLFRKGRKTNFSQSKFFQILLSEEGYACSLWICEKQNSRR